MPQITINEVSQNYTYNIGTNRYAEVAFPITAAWGPGYVDPTTLGGSATVQSVLEEVKWLRFPATQAGLEAYVSTFRGPTANYRAVKDYSYYYGMQLLTAGYDILVCRVTNGNSASGAITVGSGSLAIKAKYPGSFGNQLYIELSKVVRGNLRYFNAVIYIVSSNGSRTAVENLVFTVEETEYDSIPALSEVKSNYVTFSIASAFTDADDVAATNSTTLQGGTDTATYTTAVTSAETITVGTPALTHYPVIAGSVTITATVSAEDKTYTDDGNGNLVEGTTTVGTINYLTGALTFTTSPSAASATYTYQNAIADIKTTAFTDAKTRYALAYFGNTDAASMTAAAEYTYPASLNSATFTTWQQIVNVAQMEWVYTAAYYVYALLFDKLNYNPNRVISPGWDDQNVNQFFASPATRIDKISPLHIQIMRVSYYSRCATGLIDAPKSAPRSSIYNDSSETPGYAQMLARGSGSADVTYDAEYSDALYSTHYALIAPWGRYRLVGMTKETEASPALMTLLIQRAMILNQPIQYEWALPTNRKQNLAIGELAYKIPTKVLDQWTTLDGAGVNAIAEIPGLGTSLWGNSTSFEVPPATYQALANLSTRYLFNAVKDIAYKCGISITFQYNNQQAYDKFYAGVTPTLDTMKNVGAIKDYYVHMAADINGLDQVNANTVIGQIYLVVEGVVQNIVIDLVALPPNADITAYIQ